MNRGSLCEGSEREREREREQREVVVKGEGCGMSRMEIKRTVDNWKDESQKVNFYELVLAFRFDLYSFVYNSNLKPKAKIK